MGKGKEQCSTLYSAIETRAKGEYWSVKYSFNIKFCLEVRRCREYPSGSDVWKFLLYSTQIEFFIPLTHSNWINTNKFFWIKREGSIFRMHCYCLFHSFWERIVSRPSHHRIIDIYKQTKQKLCAPSGSLLFSVHINTRTNGERDPDIIFFFRRLFPRIWWRWRQ